jgi:hypothetical protein
MNSSDKKNVTISYNELPIQTTDYEDKEKEGKGNEKLKQEINEVNETNEINIKKKFIQEINTEEMDENEETQISWSGENYTQVIERMQFLVRGTPELSVQFLNDMIINATEKKALFIFYLEFLIFIWLSRMIWKLYPLKKINKK